jgi:anti-sigma regulatory factor (Ser/Thr protein kinase)
MVRRIVGAISRRAGASEGDVGRAELAVTELATNLLRHAAPGGSILVRPLATHGSRGVEVMSIDRGPGMRDTRASIHEGPPKLGGPSLGVGLGSVRRLSTQFDIYSRLGEGTAVLSRHAFGDAPKAGPLEVGGVSLAQQGESVSGDGWAIASSRSPCSALLVDGLGHGPKAGEAAEAAIAALGKGYMGDIEGYVRQANTAMRETRGGVIGLARIDIDQARVQFVGIGNIQGRVILPGRTRILTSRNGTLGVSMTPPETRVDSHPWAPGGILMLHSDGIRVALDARTSPSLFQHDASVIAAVLMRDGIRGTDDASVVVVKDTRGGIAS